MFENKKVIIWGTGKFQKDFQYIFDDIYPAYYVTEDNNCLTDNVFSAQKLLEEDRDDLLIIVCDFNWEQVRKRLEKWGFEHRKSFLFAEEIFSILDSPPVLHLNDRKLAFWGVGAELRYFQKNITLENEVYIDGNINKRDTFIDGKQVIYSGDIQDWNDYFIVITTMKYYPEISEILHNKGLKEERDYVYYRKLLPMEGKLSEMLRETIYAKPIQAPACLKPFQYLEIAYGGNCFCCCPAWVKHKFGNINTEICDNVWRSMAAKIFRLSIINKTYCFCKWKECPYIDDNPREDLSGDRYNNLKVASEPESLLVGIDGRCNLNCRQCRKKTFEYDEIEKNMLECQKYRIIDSKWLDKVKRLTFASYGEVFFSPVYKSLLFGGENKLGRNNIQILSNGVLFSEEYFQVLAKIYDRISVSISVDAACEETYSIVRGNHWERLNKNLKNLVAHRKRGELESIILSFCTQLCNIKEIYDFIEYARNIGVDGVIFQKIHYTEDMTMDEFEEFFSLTDRFGKVKEEVIEVLANADLQDSFVNWHQLSEYIVCAQKLVTQ